MNKKQLKVFFQFFINFLLFHITLHYKIDSLITNRTYTDK